MLTESWREAPLTKARDFSIDTEETVVEGFVIHAECLVTRAAWRVVI